MAKKQVEMTEQEHDDFRRFKEAQEAKAERKIEATESAKRRSAVADQKPQQTEKEALAKVETIEVGIMVRFFHEELGLTQGLVVNIYDHVRKARGIDEYIDEGTLIDIFCMTPVGTFSDYNEEGAPVELDNYIELGVEPADIDIVGTMVKFPKVK